MTADKPFNLYYVDTAPFEKHVNARIKLSRRVSRYPEYLQPGEIVIMENNDKQTYYSVFALSYEMHLRTIQ